jgi:hypothetical protein
VKLPPTFHIHQDFKSADPDRIAQSFRRAVERMRVGDTSPPRARVRIVSRKATKAEIADAAKRQADAEKRFRDLTAEYERGGLNMALYCIEAIAAEGFIQQAAGPRVVNAILACIERCIYRARIQSNMQNAGVIANPPARSFPTVAP